MNSKETVKKKFKASSGYMILSAILGIIIGLIMLFYPGGTMVLMEVAFTVFQILLTIFVLYYTISEALSSFHVKRKTAGWIYILIGIIATIFVWILNASIIYFIVAFFLILAGISDIITGSQITKGRYFFILLGIINIIVAVIIFKYPIILPLLIAWYVFFWGISRLLLAIELKSYIK